MDVRKEVFLTPVHCKQTSYVQPTECQLKPKRSRHFMSSLNNAMMDATNRKREASKEKKAINVKKRWEYGLHQTDSERLLI